MANSHKINNDNKVSTVSIMWNNNMEFSLPDNMTSVGVAADQQILGNTNKK